MHSNTTWEGFIHEESEWWSIRWDLRQFKWELSSTARSHKLLYLFFFEYVKRTDGIWSNSIYDHHSFASGVTSLSLALKSDRYVVNCWLMIDQRHSSFLDASVPVKILRYELTLSQWKITFLSWLRTSKHYTLPRSPSSGWSSRTHENDAVFIWWYKPWNMA